jgi:hypothetical protein
MKKALAIFCLVLPIFAFCQTDTVDLKRAKPRLLWSRSVLNTLLTGYNYQKTEDTSAETQVKRHFAEIGFHRTTVSSGYHGPMTFTYGGSVLAALDKSNIVGFRAGVWTSYFLEIGLSATYYTDFKQGNLKITPEIGFGAAGLKLAVGYNIPTFRNKDFEALRYADTQLCINYLIKLRRVKHEEHFDYFR